MATQVDIVNMALDNLRLTQKITAMGDASEPARAATRWWEPTRKALLQYPWDFSTRRVDLVQDTAVAHAHPAWMYAWTLPASFFKAQGFHPWGFRNLPREFVIPFQVAKVNDGSVRVIYSDYYPSGQDKFVYTIDASTPADYPEHFYVALAAALAVRMAGPLRVDSDIVKEAVQMWIMAWNDARAAEATDLEEAPTDASWILARG